jgi:predicted dehydrogenase
VATVTEGAPNAATGREGAYDVALIEAAYRSAREERIVHVELPEGTGGDAI